MRPVLFEIHGIKVYGYGLMIALGIIAAVYIAERISKYKNISSDDIFSLAVYAIIGGIAGGKLLYIIVEIKQFINNPGEFINTLGSGFVIYGSLLGGMAGAYMFCRKKKFNFLAVVDFLIPGVAIAQGFGRIGCFLAGCCYGKVTDSFLGVRFNSPFTPDNLPRFPTQIFSSAFDFALGIFLLLRWFKIKDEKTQGKILSLYLIIECAGRFMIEFIRDDPRGNIGPLSTSQFMSIFGFAIGVIIFIIINRRKTGSVI